MSEAIIADTSCFIIFDKIESLELLQLVYKKLYTTPDVVKEFGKPLPNWVIVEQTKNLKYQSFIRTFVDTGESSVIALGMEKADALLILDDLRARKLAKRLELKITGSIGVLFKAKEMGFIKRVKPYIERLKEKNFRISDNIIEYFLKRSGEL